MSKAGKDKAERLAAALRENLKRRKAQARIQRSEVVKGDPSVSPDGLPPPRTGED